MSNCPSSVAGHAGLATFVILGADARIQWRSRHLLNVQAPWAGRRPTYVRAQRLSNGSVAALESVREACLSEVVEREADRLRQDGFEVRVLAVPSCVPDAAFEVLQ